MVQHWRAAGLTYLKYVQVGSNAMRLGLREDVRKKMMAKEGYLITKRIWEGGKIAQACAPPPFPCNPPPPFCRARAGPRGPARGAIRGLPVTRILCTPLIHWLCSRS